MGRKSNNRKIVFGIVVAIGLVLAVSYFDLIPSDLTFNIPLSLVDDGVDTDGDGINDFEDNCPNGVNALTSRTAWFDGTLRGTFYPNSANEQPFVNHPTGTLAQHIADNKAGASNNNEKLRTTDTDQRLKLGCGGIDWDNDGTPNIRFTVKTGGLYQPIVSPDFCPYTEGKYTSGDVSKAITGAGGRTLYTVQSGCPERDYDRDGVANEIDQCWLTGGIVDPFGCPYPDTDDDGVKDNLDICPDTPSGLTVGIQGCPDGSELQCTLTEQVACFFGACECETLPDFDGDGIYDIHDSCIEEPETFNDYQDADGCPDEVPLHLLDTDLDTIFDDVDQCINEPETFNGFQDEDGCPDILPLRLIDTDLDGIFDDVDQCINEPEIYNGYQDEDGCPDIPPLHLLDTDLDGIFDDVDQCINEPENFNMIEDTDGCPDDIVAVIIVIDIDSDGVDDTADLCLGTLPNTQVDSTGCAIPIINAIVSTPDDFDGDGIFDNVDDCPASGGDVDQFGCPVMNPVQDFFEDIFNDEEEPPEVRIDCNEGFEQNPDGSLTCIRIDPNFIPLPLETTEPSTEIDETIDPVLLLLLLLVLILVIVSILVKSGKAKL